MSRTGLPVYLGLVAVFLGCPATTTTKNVLTTLPLHASLARQLAGDWVSARSVYDIGENPFKALANKPAALGDVSDIGLYIGIGDIYDASLIVQFRSLKPTAKLVYPYDTNGFRSNEYFVWTDPSEARDMVDIVLEGLNSLLPEHAEEMARRALALKREFNEEFQREVHLPRAAPRKSFYLLSPAGFYPVERLFGPALSAPSTRIPGLKLTADELQTAVSKLREAELPPVILYCRYDDAEDVRRLADAAHATTAEILLFPEDLKPGATLIEMHQENSRRVVEASQ